MELKDLIQQTIDELSLLAKEEKYPRSEENPKKDSSKKENVSVEIHIDPKFLELLREKTLVLFEGLQSSEIKDLNTKLDLVLNYLQYQLSILDEALEV